MTPTVAPTSSKTSLYDRDLNLWLEEAIAQLKCGDFQNLDVVNLIEELEGLAGRDRRELENRLTTLLEHLLKRCYVKSDRDYDGWVRTINRTRMEIRKILKQSPSFKNFANSPELFQDAFDDALKLMQSDPDYKSVSFPDTWQFRREIDIILNVDFWEEM
jgi:hypothetical protein